MRPFYRHEKAGRAGISEGLAAFDNLVDQRLVVGLGLEEQVGACIDKEVRADRLPDCRDSPRLQIERVVREVPLPLNVIAFPGAPDKKLWVEAGVARISHGPFPHKALMVKLTEMARVAID